MKKTKCLMVGLIVLLCGTGAALAEGEIEISQDKIEFELTTDFFSKYIWRGQKLNDDYVFQTGLSTGYKGFTVAAWGNMDLTDYGNNKGEFTEWDYSLDYSNSIGENGKLGYSVGIINYHFPSIVGDTTEVYWGLSLDVFLNPSVTVYHDIDTVKGMYVNFGISHSIEDFIKLTDSLSANLDLSASIGWGNSSYNRAYWGVDNSKLNDIAFTVALPVELGGGWTVTPSFNFVTLVSSDIRDSDAFSTDSDYFFTGVSISKSF